MSDFRNVIPKTEIIPTIQTFFRRNWPNYISTRKHWKKVLSLQILFTLLFSIVNFTEIIKLSDSEDTIFYILRSLYFIFFVYYLFTFNMILVIFGPIFFWSYSNKFLSDSVGYISDMSRDLSFNGVQQNVSFYPMEDLVAIVGGTILLSYLLIQNEFNNLFKPPEEKSLKYNNKSLTHLNDLLHYLQIMPLWIISGLVIGIILEGNIGSLSLLSILPAALRGLFIGTFLGLLAGFTIRGYHSSLFAMMMFLFAYFFVPSMDLSSSVQIPLFFIGGAVLTSFLLVQDNVSDIFKLKSIDDFKNLQNNPKLLISIISLMI